MEHSIFSYFFYFRAQCRSRDLNIFKLETYHQVSVPSWVEDMVATCQQGAPLDKPCSASEGSPKKRSKQFPAAIFGQKSLMHKALGSLSSAISGQSSSNKKSWAQLGDESRKNQDVLPLQAYTVHTSEISTRGRYRPCNDPSWTMPFSRDDLWWFCGLFFAL